MGDAANRMLDELLEANRAHASLPGRPSAPLRDCLHAAREQLSAALARAGVSEHRAIVAGGGESERAAGLHSDALAGVDVAYATLWAYEAASQRVRIDEVDKRRAEALGRIAALAEVKRKALAAGDPKLQAEGLESTLSRLRDEHRELATIAYLTDAEVSFPMPQKAENDEKDEDADVKPPPPQQQQQKEVRQRLRKAGRAMMATGGGMPRLTAPSRFSPRRH